MVWQKKWGKKTSSVKIATACITFLTFNFNIRYLTVCLYYWHWYEVIADSLDSGDNLKAHIFWYQTEHLRLDEIQFGSIDYLIRLMFDIYTKNVPTVAHRTISKNLTYESLFELSYSSFYKFTFPIFYSFLKNAKYFGIIQIFILIQFLKNEIVVGM